MFSIGLFSTYLPYILIAMFYGAYIGIHTIIRAELQEDTDGKEIAVKQINVERDSHNHRTEKRTYYYGNQPVFEKQDQPLLQVYIVSQTIYEGGKIALPRARYCTTLFCRPPPAA